MYKLTNSSSITRIEDGSSIPNDPANTDYSAFLKWLSEGNTPEPADIPDPKLAIAAQITQLESAQMMPRITREFMLGFTEAQFTPAQLAQNFGYQKLKEFDGQIKALRAQL